MRWLADAERALQDSRVEGPVAQSTLDFGGALDAAISEVMSIEGVDSDVAEHILLNSCVLLRLPQLNDMLLPRRMELMHRIKRIPTRGVGCTGLQRVLGHLCSPLFISQEDMIGPLAELGNVLDKVEAALELQNGRSATPRLSNKFQPERNAIADLKDVHNGLDALDPERCHLFTIYVMAWKSSDAPEPGPVGTATRIPASAQEHDALSLLAAPGGKFLPLHASMKLHGLREWLHGTGSANAAAFAGGGWLNRHGAHAFLHYGLLGTLPTSCLGRWGTVTFALKNQPGLLESLETEHVPFPLPLRISHSPTGRLSAGTWPSLSDTARRFALASEPLIDEPADEPDPDVCFHVECTSNSFEPEDFHTTLALTLAAIRDGSVAPLMYFE